MVTDARDAAFGEGPDNETVRRAIAEQLRDTVPPGAAGPVLGVRTGAIQCHVFSIVFPAWVSGRDGTRALFVKIPKHDLRKREPRVFPITAEDRQLAIGEFDSLKHLAANWLADDLEVSFVEPLRFLGFYNAIITAYARGMDGCEQFRRWDLMRRIGDRASARRLRRVMFRFGQALRRFHDRTSAPAEFDGRVLEGKLKRYVNGLREQRGDRPALQAAEAIAERLSTVRRPARTSSTLKGIDIRNLLVGQRDRVTILDPGRIKTTWPEADLARFLVTYRILWWGSPLFLTYMRPDRVAEASLLDGYSRAGCWDRELFAFQMIKEMLKHWHTAHDSLSLQPWPGMVKRVLAAGWIDRFYARQVLAETTDEA